MQLSFHFLLDALSPVLGADTTDAVNTAANDVAEAAGAATGSAAEALPPTGLFGSIWIWVAYAVILGGAYFLIMRPQRKREKKMKEMQASIKAGDNIITSGGLYGRVADVGEDCFIIEFGTNRGVRIPVQKSDVLGIKAPKTTPAPKDVLESPK